MICVGGRTGRDGLHGATFSSMSLTTESHEEDIQAVQIGNPIEEKKACDFVLDARERGLIVFITDCGAGGFSSCRRGDAERDRRQPLPRALPAQGAGLGQLGDLPIREPGTHGAWRSREESLPELQSLADTYETELTVIGESDDSGVLKVWHDGELVCELDNARLHDAPVRRLKSEFTAPVIDPGLSFDDSDLPGDLKRVLSDFAVVSREPIIREYDHEVQGNTVLKPLAGAEGDAPQDASVVQIDGSEKLMALGLSILPEWGKTDPYAMGRGCVDECVRQLVLAGADPDRIALLDNFCVGDPEKPGELGQLVESVKGIASAALDYSAPFVSGKDSFYNYFETKDGPVSIPVTCVISGMGVVDDLGHVTGSSIRKAGSALCLLGLTTDALGGSVYARVKRITGSAVPATDTAAALDAYRKYHRAVKQGLVLSAHDVSEGGLAVTAAEMAFSMKAGVVIDLDDLPYQGSSDSAAALLFSEAPSRILIEVSQANVDALAAHFEGCAFAVVGKTDGQLRHLRVTRGDETLIDEELSELKHLWKNGLTPYY